ncbi:MAG: molybdopterin-dependent oxidoreductase [Dehalococcoidia bacterium]
MIQDCPSSCDAREASGADTLVPTFCFQCNAGPDLLKVSVRNGVATAIQPNFDLRGVHPADGRVCVKAYGLIQKAYNPHRILHPMRRTNPRKGRNEDPGFTRISWDEAYSIMASKLLEAREKGLLDESGYPRLAASFGEAATPVSHMGTFMAFLAAWGPVDYGIGAGQGIKCYHSEHLFGEYWHRSFTVTADAPNCDYIISMGANAEASTGVTGVFRNANARSRGTIRIQVEPHLSVTGAVATEWLPIRPKTDTAFLFALLHVLLHEHDESELDIAFLKSSTSSPYLVGPHGYYLRERSTLKPLVWDRISGQAVPYDTRGIDPALTGRFEVSGVEIGPDAVCWEHDPVAVTTAHTMLRDHVAGYSPQWASAICDIDEAVIRRVANDFLRHAQVGKVIEIEGQTLPHRPVAVVLGKSVNNGWGAYQCVWARTVLACLVGALEVPGGTIGTSTTLNRPMNRVDSVAPGEDGFMKLNLNPTESGKWTGVPKARNAYNVLIPLVGDGPSSQALGPTHLPWLFQDEPAQHLPPYTLPDVWIVYRTNPGVSSWDTPGVTRKMSEFPFTIAFAYTLDETNYMADILLPDAMDLESTQLIRMGATNTMEQFWRHRGFGLRQPVISPRGEAKEFTEIAQELAKRTGLLESYNRMLNKGLAGLRLSGTNYDFTIDIRNEHSVAEIWDRLCRAASAELTSGANSDGLDWYKSNGCKFVPYSQLNWYLYPRMVSQGLRFELPYQERYARIGQQLGNRLHERGIHWWDEQLKEYEFLPHWNDLAEIWERDIRQSGRDPADYPFWLVTANSMQYAWGSNVSLQVIHELAANVGAHSGLVVNAAVARRMGIREGDEVELFTPTRTTSGRVTLREGIRPDTLLAIGKFSHWITPIAKDVQVPNLNELAPISLALTDAMGSGVDLVRVSIRRRQ